jgi:hypothetical protein
VWTNCWNYEPTFLSSMMRTDATVARVTCCRVLLQLCGKGGACMMRSAACAMKAKRSAPTSVPGYMHNVHSTATWVRCARPARLVPLAVPLAPPRWQAPPRAAAGGGRMLSAGPKLSTGDGYVKGQADSSTDIALQVRVMSAQMRARPG